MNLRILSALQRLNELIDEGGYFYALLPRVAAQYGLSPSEGLALTCLYDAQG